MMPLLFNFFLTSLGLDDNTSSHVLLRKLFNIVDFYQEFYINSLQKKKKKYI
jgi:hypothetical protein